MIIIEKFVCLKKRLGGWIAELLCVQIAEKFQFLYAFLKLGLRVLCL